MDALRYRDPENSLGKADHECMQDTDQEQPNIQLETSHDYIPIHERNWKDIIADEFSHRHKGESQISKVVSKLDWFDMKIAETEKQMEQFIGN